MAKMREKLLWVSRLMQVDYSIHALGNLNFEYTFTSIECKDLSIVIHVKMK
jgi:hypothetical protein